jgi:hypothetical protein
MGDVSLSFPNTCNRSSPMALYRLVCALGHQSLVTMLTRCGLALPGYFLAAVWSGGGRRASTNSGGAASTWAISMYWPAPV